MNSGASETYTMTCQHAKPKKSGAYGGSGHAGASAAIARNPSAPEPYATALLEKKKCMLCTLLCV